MCGTSTPPAQSRPTVSSTPDAAILARLTDAHCHPSDDDTVQKAVASIKELKTGRLCAQSSTLDNQSSTSQIFEAHSSRIIPFYGLHPWFVHAISLVDAVTPPSKEEHYASLFPSSQEPSQPDPLLHPLLPSLPEPTLLSTFLSDLEANLSRTPSALVGEVGLDQAFRIPFSSPIDGKKNSELATPLAHQLAVLQAQLGVAVKLQRHVSFHSVRSPMDTVKLLDGMKKVEGWERIHVCLHSFGGSPETAKQIQRSHRNIFFSFATIISGRSPKFHDLLRAIEPDRLLVESDYSDTSKIDEQIWEVFQAVCTAREWATSDAVHRLESNWLRFLEVEPAGSGIKKSKKERRLEMEARRREADVQDSDEEQGD